MIREVIIFNEIRQRPEFNYSGAQIVDWTGLDKSAVSRFLNGKTDLPMSRFFQLVSSMPTPFQDAYWSELLGSERKGEGSWRSVISEASIADIEEILGALTERWGKLSKSQEKDLAGVR